MGRALKFYSSVRLDIRKIESIKKSGEIIGNHVRVKVVKNKVAPPFREAEFDIMFGVGIDRAGDIIDFAIAGNVVEKSGAWFTYKNNRWQGKDNMKKFLMENPEIMEEIRKEITKPKAE